MGKFSLMLWKNWVIHKRHLIQTVAVIVFPILPCLLLVFLRQSTETESMPEIEYPPFNPVSSTTNFQIMELAYTPNNSLIKDHILNNFPFKITPFNSAKELEDYLITQENTEKIIGVIFDIDRNADKFSQSINFKLRFPAETETETETGKDNWQTNDLFPMFNRPGLRERDEKETPKPGYYQTGFLTVQTNISLALINYLAKNKNDTNINTTAQNLPDLLMQRFSYPAYIEDKFMEVVTDMLALFMVMCNIYSVGIMIKIVTLEKENQLKESMKIMGLPVWLHWASWFTMFLITLTISMIMIVVILKMDVWYSNSNTPAILPRTNEYLLFMLLFIYAFTIITYCFMISAFFSKANLANIFGTLVYFLFLFPFFFTRESKSLSAKLSSSLFSNTAFALGFQVIVGHENVGKGLQWNNLWKPVTPEDNLCMGYILLMLLFDAVLYLLITLYFEALFPGPNGVPKKWNFFLSCFQRKYRVESIARDDEVIHNPFSYEKEPTNLKPGISILHLRKVFKTKNVAVKDFSLNMFEEQITVLLGHNGAGKTTTMLMLTGMLPVTSGTATINGYDITREIDKVRHSLGFCPQHNILFNELTVSEHIYFYSKLKGMKKQDIPPAIDNYLRLLQFEDKRNKRTSTLSGGMKRKLSVAVAFCGNSKIVMLDEPTSGMDPTARRALWDLIQTQKKGRTILLTTHFMDEADILGDRIAIMANGELQCCGSSFFLKKKYGTGYRLVIDKGPNCDVQKVTNLIKGHIPKIKTESNVGSELIYLLNKEDSPVFQNMLKDIEENRVTLGVRSYGILFTTLEEVFMKTGADHVSNKEDIKQPERPESTSDFRLHVEHVEETLLTGCKLKISQIRALFLKRILTSLRSWSLILLEIVLPIILIIAAMYMGKALTVKDLPKLPIKLDSYDHPVTLISSYDENNIYYNSMKNMLTKQTYEIDDIGKGSINDEILKLTKENLTKVRENYITGATFKSDQVIAWFNNDPYHSPPLALNLVINSLLKAKSDENYEINVSNEPLPFTVEAKDRFTKKENLGFEVGTSIGVLMSFISAFYILFYIRERASKFKHLQLVSGVNIFIFWAVSFIWDCITYLVTVIVIFIILLCFQERGFSSAADIGRLSVIFLCFVFAMLPLIYLASFLFDVPTTGFIVFVFISFSGVVGILIIKMLSSLKNKDISKILDWIFLILPAYSLCSGIENVYIEYNRNYNCKKTVDICIRATQKFQPSPSEMCWDMVCKRMEYCCWKEEGYFRWERPGILRNIVFSMAVGCFMIILLLLIESKFFSKIYYALVNNNLRNVDLDDDDVDVIEENKRIRKMTPYEIKNQSLVLQNITKYYKKFLAVNGICLGVNRYECFGLLGVNGAGKTTTFKMITGDIHITYGNVFVKGLNLKKQIKKANKFIGYCPQFDALLDDLTPRETIKIFCLLRGFTSSKCDSQAIKLAQEFDFFKHLNKRVKQLSGGNKRKLSTAIAIVGDPAIIYLDEPSTGMDPATKRNLWDVLCKYRDSGKCLVLTSHSMEECEALCTRIAIMVNGRFKCLGSIQHLKSKFSDGYTLTIQLRKESNSENQARSSDEIEKFIKKSFPSAVLKEKTQELITYQITDTSVSLSKMFGIMESAKRSFNIEDYSLAQASLEQVFLNLTKFQYNDMI